LIDKPGGLSVGKLFSERGSMQRHGSLSEDPLPMLYDNELTSVTEVVGIIRLRHTLGAAVGWQVKHRQA
jgi:hypothetical protein